MTRASLCLIVGLTLAAPADAQWGRLKEKVKERGERIEDKAIDKTLDAIVCVVTDQQCIDKANKEGKPVVLTDASGKRLPDRQPAPAQQAKQAPSAAVPAADEERDFAPGEKLVFFDDYTDMAKGAAPPHWKVRGGAAKLTTAGRLGLTDRVKLYPNIKELPKNFTVETEFVPSKASGGQIGWIFENEDSTFQWQARFQFDPGEIWATVNVMDEGWTQIGEGRVKIQYGKPNRLAIWYQNERVRLYVNDQKAVDLNQMELKPFERALLDFGSDSPAELGAVRIAESVPDISETLFSSGKYISHAIQFDVGSDTLRPESMNVLRTVADALQKQPSIKVSIEGHTDSTGDAAMNLDLSKRRAASVKAGLVSLGITADRLTTDGFGQTKPIAPNDTPQGRAENRRVEFVTVS